MSTATINTTDYLPTPATEQKFVRKGPLALIVLAHIGLFYLLQNGLKNDTPVAASAQPKELVATFITPEPVVKPPKPQPVTPKTVPIVKKVIPQIKSPTPVVNTTPSEKAITAPAPQPAPPTPPAPVVSEAPVEAPRASPQPSPSAPIKTITSGIEYLRQQQPQYPSASRRMGEEGKVVFRVLVNEKGLPERVEVQTTSGFERLDQAGRQSVLQSQFKPYIENGRAMPAYVIVPINFQLNY